MESEEDSNILYIYLPSNTPVCSKILNDLGKPTKRGIKKCYKCGIYNGTRGIVCKNKQCDAVFKDSGFKRKANLDSIRLLTGNFRQVFSVRVRDMGPDYRGFVQLPLLHSHVKGEIFSEVALCFVDSCQRLFDDSILQCHENEFRKPSPLCIHIKSALRSKSLATVLEIKREILNVLKIRTETKEKLWLLATDKEGPLVQRISKNVMAVKCQVTPKHPLGYLHFRFLSRKGKEIYDSYVCTCTESPVSHGRSCNIQLKCLHYYACICSLASHAKYSEEFQHLISLELSSNGIAEEMSPRIVIDSLRSNLFEQKVDNGMQKCLNRIAKVKQVPKRTLNGSKFRKLIPKAIRLQVKILNDKKENIIHKTYSEDVSWSFIDWLSSATESINETMQLANCMILNTLIFHIPEIFYASLYRRISNSIFEENIASTHEQTFHLNSVIQLKQIFDTSKVELMARKHLIQDTPYLEEGSDNRPVNYVLQFDLDSPNSEIVNSFVIEWLPDVLSITKLGQLKFKYRFIVKTC